MKFNRITKHFDDYCDEQFLGLFRIVFCLFFLLFNGMYKYDYIDVTPYELHNYISIMNLLNAYPSAFILNTLQGLLFVSAFAVLIGWHTRFFSISTFLLFAFTFSAPFSLGASSTPIYIYFTFLIFAFSSWGNYFSIDNLNKKKSTSKRFDKIAVIIYFLTFTEGFFLSGLCKMMGGWLNWDHQAMLIYWHTNELWNMRTGIINSTNFSINSRYFWELMDYIVVIGEMAPFLLIWNKRLLKIALIGIGTFHIFVWFFMEICFNFFPLMYVFYVVEPLFIKNQTRIYDLLKKIFSPENAKRLKWLVIISTIVYLLIYINRTSELWEIIYELDFVIGMFCSYLLLIYAAATNFSKRHD